MLSVLKCTASLTSIPAQDGTSPSLSILRPRRGLGIVLVNFSTCFCLRCRKHFLTGGRSMPWQGSCSCSQPWAFLDFPASVQRWHSSIEHVIHFEDVLFGILNTSFPVVVKRSKVLFSLFELFAASYAGGHGSGWKEICRFLLNFNQHCFVVTKQG